jgi:hypothetical protein
MDNETKTEGVADTNDTNVEATDVDTIAISKSEYEKMNQTLGSLKRELKDLKKPKEESKENSTKLDVNPILEKMERMSLRQAGITHSDDVELAKATAKKWGVDIDEVLMDDDFKIKLERQQTSRSNVAATSNVRGGAGSSQAKNTPEYWIAKGTPPTATDIPDRKTRVKVFRAMVENTKSGKKFYND